MIGSLGAVGVALVALPALLARWGARLHPADWARWVVASLVAGASAIQLALMLAAASTVLRSLGVHGLAAVCARMAGAAPPGGVAVGWVAAVGAVALPSLMLLSWWAGRRTQRRVAAASELAPPLVRLGASVRVLDVDEPVAFSVPASSGGHVVLSAPLIEALADEELSAVVRHERAHLRHRHGSYLLLAAALDVGLGVHPLVRRSTAVLRCALERWADEEAAGGTREARAATRAALLATALAPLPTGVMGFGPVETIVSRVVALEGPAPRSGWRVRWAASAPLAAIVLVAVIMAGLAGGNLWSAVTMPVTCRIPVS